MVAIVRMANHAVAGILPVWPNAPIEKMAQYNIIPKAARLRGIPHFCPARTPDPPNITATAVRNSARRRKVVSNGF